MSNSPGRPNVVPAKIVANGYKVDDGRDHIHTLKHWHQTIVDYLLVNPSATNKNIAEFFKMQPMWVGRVRNTDAFREYYSMRMQEHRGFMQETIVAKMHGVAAKALDKISEKMDNGDVAMGQLQSAAEMSLKALGYGQKPVNGVSVSVNSGGNIQVMSVSSEALEKARQKLAERRVANSAEISIEASDYQHVTASLEVGVKDVDADANNN